MNLIFTIQKNLRNIPAKSRLVVGISGGADSVGLVLALKELKYDLVLTHLNHSLRGRESDEDAKFVRHFAQQHKLPCVVQKIRIAKKGNLEANARQKRYEFLEEVHKSYKADYIAVAHHQDDQVETIFLNMQRGAGLRGLRGMKFQRDHIIRPFLNIPRSAILDFLQSRHQTYREDSSNQDVRYRRNQIRHQLLPALQKNNPGVTRDLLEIGERAKKELEKLAPRAQGWIRRQVKKGRFNRSVFKLLSPALKAEVLIQLLGAPDLYSKNLQLLINFIVTGKTGKEIMVKGKTFRLEYDEVIMDPPEGAIDPSTSLRFARDDNTRLQDELSFKKQITKTGIRWGQWFLKNSSNRSFFVRSWKPGDRFQPGGMKGHKKLQDFFTDLKIPKTDRGQVPLIVDRYDKILAVGDLRFDEQALTLKTKWTLKHLS